MNCLGLIEQYRAAFVVIHGLGRTAKIQVNRVRPKLDRRECTLAHGIWVIAKQLHVNGRATGGLTICV